jgi:F420-0:gamma-glutamyl ligase-like protein
LLDSIITKAETNGILITALKKEDIPQIIKNLTLIIVGNKANKELIPAPIAIAGAIKPPEHPAIKVNIVVSILPKTDSNDNNKLLF